MNKAILLCASIGWQTIYDEKGRPKARHIGVSVSWMPYEISYKRCGFNHHISGEYAKLMQREPQRIEMMVDNIARCFASAAAKLMEQHHAELSDMSEALHSKRMAKCKQRVKEYINRRQIHLHDVAIEVESAPPIRWEARRNSATAAHLDRIFNNPI